MEKKPTMEQGPQEKAATPWRVQFTCGKPKPTYTDIRKDLLNACWGNNKMADLLYHFLVVGSWETHNNHIGNDIRKVIVQETHAKIQTKVKVSEPTLVSHLKAFAGAGYVRKASYRGAFEVDFDAIEKAFSDAPSKHSTSQPKTDDLSLNLSLSQEVKELREEVQKLREQMQDLSLTLVSFKFQHAQSEGPFKFNLSLPLVSANCDETATAANLAHIFKFAETKELYLNESWGLASVAGLRGENLSKNILDIRDIRDLDKESERRSVALASQSHAQSSSQDAVVEEPYVPDNLSQFTEMSPVLQEHRVLEKQVAELQQVVETQAIRIVKPTIQAAPSIDNPVNVVPEPAGYTQGSTKPEVATLTAPVQQQARAKVAPAQAQPKQHKLVTPSLFGSGAPARPQLTEKGEEVRLWYSTIRATGVRKTKENVDACNGLAECDGISFENLKAAIEHWEADEYVKSRGIVVDLQKLEKSGGPFSFEKAMVAIRNKQKAEEAAKAAKEKSSAPGTQSIVGASGRRRLDVPPPATRMAQA